MKKVIVFLVIFSLCILPVQAHASGATVEVKVNGQVKKGENIEILVNVKNVEGFYAASVDFIYDTTLLKVESIAAAEFITKYSNEIMELGGETDKNGNTASYSFTFLGDKPGIKGSGTIATINATVLKNGKLSISQDNMKVKLVKKSENNVVNYEYRFIGYGIPSNGTSNDGNDSEINIGSGSNSGNNIGNNNKPTDSNGSNNQGGSNSGSNNTNDSGVDNNETVENNGSSNQGSNNSESNNTNDDGIGNSGTNGNNVSSNLGSNNSGLNNINNASIENNETNGNGSSSNLSSNNSEPNDTNNSSVGNKEADSNNNSSNVGNNGSESNNISSYDEQNKEEISKDLNGEESENKETKSLIYIILGIITLAGLSYGYYAYKKKSIVKDDNDIKA